MSKYLVSFFVAMVLTSTNFSATAQNRYADIEIKTHLPEGTTENFNVLGLKFDIINHGPDKLLKGDSLIFMTFLRSEDSSMIIMKQDLALIGKDIDSGDFGTYDEPILGAVIGLTDLYTTQTFDFCVQAFTSVLLTSGDSLKLSYQDLNPDNDISCTKLTVTPKGVSIEDHGESTNVGYSLFPNPAQDKINLKLAENFHKEALVTINDGSGRIIRQQEYREEHLKSGNLSLDITTLPPGIYFVTVQNSQAKVVKKLTVLR